MKLRIYPDSVLRLTATPVKDIDGEIYNLIEDMAELMNAHKGIGLAAPQVGKQQRIIIVNNDGKIIPLINPKIVEEKGEVYSVESCLSLPGIWLEIRRSHSVFVQYINQNGKEVQKEFVGLMARIIKHEIDHLNGIFILDYVSTTVKCLINRKYATLPILF